MARDVKSYTLLNAAAPRAIASSTNASPIEVTTAAPHGYTTGQKVAIVGHTVNTNANGRWVVTVTGASTFELDGSVGNGVGGATGTHYAAFKTAQLEDFAHAVLSLDSDGGGDAALTVKIAGSIQESLPNFAAPQAPDNQYEFIQIIDLQDSVEVNGDTGIVLAAGDVNRMFEVNVNGLRWLTAIITTGTEGELTAKVRLYTD
jgi:hypothetical protein